MKHIVLLGLFQKQEDTWVSLTWWNVLGFPNNQAMEMINKTCQGGLFHRTLMVPFVLEAVLYF